MITVIAGVVVTHHPVPHRRLLLSQRPVNKDYALTWECPGGKVFGNEHHHDTIRREFKEELGMRIGTISDTPLTKVEMKDLDLLIVFYRVHGWVGPVMPLESQGYGWFTRNEARGLALTPGNLRAEVDILRAAFT